MKKYIRPAFSVILLKEPICFGANSHEATGSLAPRHSDFFDDDEADIANEVWTDTE